MIEVYLMWNDDFKIVQVDICLRPNQFSFNLTKVCNKIG